MSTREEFEKWYVNVLSNIHYGQIKNGMALAFDAGRQACVANYKAELLKRDALIAEKDKALRELIGNQTKDCILDSGVTFPRINSVLAAIEALALAPENCRLVPLDGKYFKDEHKYVKIGTQYENVPEAVKLYIIEVVE